MKLGFLALLGVAALLAVPRTAPTSHKARPSVHYHVAVNPTAHPPQSILGAVEETIFQSIYMKGWDPVPRNTCKRDTPYWRVTVADFDYRMAEGSAPTVDLRVDVMYLGRFSFGEECASLATFYLDDVTALSLRLYMELFFEGLIPYAEMPGA